MPPTASETATAFDLQQAGLRSAERAYMPRRMLRMSFASYGIDTLLLGLVWLAGVDAGGAVWAIAFGGASIHLAFDQVFRSGWNERCRDRYLTVPQLLASSALVLGVASQTPEVALPLLSVLFIVFAFASLRLSPRQAIAAWAGVSVAIALLFAAAPQPLSMPGATPAQAMLSALWLCLVLGRCALVGLYGSRLRQTLVRRGRELAHVSGELRTLAMRDALTGALNRRAIMQVLDDALLADPSAGPSVAVILVDMDHFKAVNDRFGHPVGDEVLRRFVVASMRVLRGADRLGRYGGEEFLLVLPGVAGGDAATTIAERLRGAVAAHAWKEIAADLRVTISLGVVDVRPGESARTVLERADRALYRAKHDGRDCVRTDLPPTRS